MLSDGDYLENFYSRTKFFKRDALKILMRSPLYYITYGITAMVIFYGVSSLYGFFSHAVRSVFDDTVSFCAELLFFATFFVVLSPLLLFLFRNADGTVYGSLCGAYRDNKAYIKGLKISFIIILLYTSFFFISTYALYSVKYILRLITVGTAVVDSLIAVMIYCAAIILISLLDVSLNTFFMLPYSDIDLYCVSECVEFSRKLMRGYKLELFFFQLSFLPLFITVYFSFGITFIFVLPYYLISLRTFASYINESSKDTLCFSFI